MTKKRVAAFIDGFNLYYAIDNLAKNGPYNHLKWLNLRLLTEMFFPTSQYELVTVKYFTTLPKRRSSRAWRHRTFVNALGTVGVETILGNFKPKDHECIECGHKWKALEEKETDVNVAIHALSGAYKNEYDMATLVTADSDLAPVIRMITAETSKPVRILFPIDQTSYELMQSVNGPKMISYMQLLHIERSLFPREVRNSSGQVIAIRPIE